MRKLVPHSIKGHLLFFIGFSFILSSCLKEEVDFEIPNTGAVQIQLHNFNAPLSGRSLEGSAPDIYYFKQKEDGTYVFMLTSTNYQGFQTNWATDYIIGHADAAGIIKKTEVMKLPTKNGITGTFDRVWDSYPSWAANDASGVGPTYVADNNGFLYYQVDYPCYCRIQYFNLDPETGKTDYYSIGPWPVWPQFFRTYDQGFISVGGPGAPDYNKFSKSGVLEYKQPLRYFEARPMFNFLTDRNEDSYFIVLYNGQSVYYPPTTEWFTENTAKSFFNLRDHWLSYPPKISIEIRFGPGKTQKAHHFMRSTGYKDYVDVPFETWDITNNRQLMASFRDQGEDGAFDLVPMNVNWGGGFYYGPSFTSDPTASQEWILINIVPYASTPDNAIVAEGPLSQPFFGIFGYLAEGATWNPASLPTSSISLKIGPRPGPQLLKVNATGSTVVKDNFIIGTVPLINIYKSVPYNDGSAILINAPSTSDYQPSQLVVLDANFNQKNAITMTSTPSDYSHQLEGSNDRVFYARITSTTESTKENSNKGSLLLYTIRNGFSKERNLDEFIPFKLEKYRMTPTRTGGVAIVAWVRPTKDTRDLLFFELDENLELVKR